jgi:PAS domain S-box-containing protein
MTSTHWKKPTGEDLALLEEVSSMLTVIDRERLLDRILEVTTTAFGAERASILLNPAAPDEWSLALLHYASSTGAVERADQTQSIRYARRVMTSGLAGWVVRELRGAVLTDTLEDPRWVTFSDSTSLARSAMCVPFVWRDTVLGVLTLLHTEPGQFDETDLRILTIIANQTSIALNNAQLFFQTEQHRRQLEAILAAQPDVLLVLDSAGQVLTANEAAAQLVRLPPESLIGQSLDQLAGHDTTLRQVQELLSGSMPGALTLTSEVRSDFHHRDYLAQVSGWQSTDGRTGQVIVLRDITQMRDLNRFKDEMLHVASHDLRSPLALIVGYCSLISLDLPADSPVNDYLSAIEKATTRMQQLLDDLLRVEKIRTSPLELMEAVDFGELLRTALNAMRPHFDVHQQKLEAHLELDRAPLVRVNAPLIREVLENYLDNASKYSPEHSSILLRSWLNGGRVYVTVEDSGMGIPPHDLGRVFEAFYRARQPGMEGIEGRGLGLNLVKVVVERHRGQVWVESEPGKGSTFGFWLPYSS